MDKNENTGSDIKVTESVLWKYHVSVQSTNEFTILQTVDITGITVRENVSR